MRKKYKICSILVCCCCIFLSCNHKVIIPAQYDALLLSSFPHLNFDGKKEAAFNLGYGTVHAAGTHFITYPALYLGSGNEDSVKDSFVLGGFNLDPVKGKIARAELKLFIHSVTHTRRRIIIFVRPLLKAWQESEITYADVYQTSSDGSPLTELVDPDEKNASLSYFNVKANRIKQKMVQIPLFKPNKIIRIDVTRIIKKWRQDPHTNHGLLIEPMWQSDLRYTTTNLAGEITYTGSIEIAATEWYDWDGRVPDYFKINYSYWKDIKNKAYFKQKYIPHLEIFFSK